MKLFLATALILFGFAAISIADQTSFSQGLIRNSCAPWDGAAIELTLSSEPAQCQRTPEPYLAVGVWRGLPIHAGQVVKFDTRSDNGFASRCAKVGNCERAEEGTIEFQKYQESGASGRYELHFKTGEVLKGTLEVKWCKERAICG